jgi:hypothetical protein
LSRQYKNDKDLVMRKNLAVAEFTALTPELKAEGHQATVREMAISRLANSAVFVVVERESVDKLLREQAFQLTGATQQRDAVRLGNLLNAHAFLTGTLAESAMEPMGALPAGPEVDERYRGYGHTWKTEVFALHLGAGAEYYVSPRLALSLRAYYTWAKADIRTQPQNIPVDMSGIGFTPTVSLYF